MRSQQLEQSEEIVLLQ